MAHPPHASAAAKSENEPSFDDDPHSEVTLARDVLRADGLNAIEQSEREAALQLNRAEEAAIFERAASRLRPSWSEADQMLDLGLAHAAVPEVVVPEVVVPAAVQAAPAVVAPPAAVPVQSYPAVTAPSAYPAVVPSTSYVSSSEITDGYPARGGLGANGRALLKDKRYLIAAAVGCIALGGLWAALSGGEDKAPAAAVAPAAPALAAPAIAETPAPVAAPAPVAPPAPVATKPAPARELTREEVSALLGVAAPKPAKKAAARPAAKPAAKQVAKNGKQAPAAAKKPAPKKR